MKRSGSMITLLEGIPFGIVDDDNEGEFYVMFQIYVQCTEYQYN